MEFSELEHVIHVAGTSILILLYVLRLVILMRRRPLTDRSPDPRNDITKGVVEAFLTIVMPWRMESTRRHWIRYAEFVAFHIGVFICILVSFAITYAPGWVGGPVRTTLIALMAIGLLAGTVRFARRLTDPQMRIISSFDDYISVVLVLVFLATGVLTLGGADWAFLVYFAVAAFLLVYEPFSKIRHYIYYPFARVYYGREFARKGILG